MIFNLLLQYVLELFFKICVCVLFLVFVFLIFCCVHFLVCVFLLLCLNNWFCVLHFKVKALTCSMTQILTSKRCYKDFDKGNGFCGIRDVLLFVWIVLKNALTFLKMSILIREMYRSNRETLSFFSSSKPFFKTHFNPIHPHLSLLKIKCGLWVWTFTHSWYAV